MRIYRVAICVHRKGDRTVLYVGEGILSYGQAWLVLEWDEARHEPVKRIPLDPALLLTTAPNDLGVQADWAYVVDMPIRGLH